jgi:hypothetical protein
MSVVWWATAGKEATLTAGQHETAPRVLTLREWCDDNEREPWHGMATAFRSGAKARLIGGPCNYGRSDFIQAWERGYAAMNAYLKSGNQVAAMLPVPLPRKEETA